MKKSFLDSYKTYDTSQGYGSEKEWRNEFHGRMGFEEAEATLKADPDTPLGILCSGEHATWSEIKKAYRAKAREFHPDMNKDRDTTEQMKRINAAYVILERKHGK